MHEAGMPFPVNRASNSFNVSIVRSQLVRQGESESNQRFETIRTLSSKPRLCLLPRNPAAWTAGVHLAN